MSYHFIKDEVNMKRRCVRLAGFLMVLVCVFAMVGCDQGASQQVNVTFDSNGGSAVAGFKLTIGSALELPVAPTKEHYTFAGWYNGGTQIQQGAFLFTDTTLLAKWEGVAVTVSFDKNGGDTDSNPTTLNLRYGEPYSFPVNEPGKAEYVFAGWYTEQTDGTKVTTETKLEQALVLYAHWTAATYTVSFNSNGGSSATDQTVTYAGAYGALPVTTRTGYTFNGWYTAASGGTKVESTTSVTMTADHTLYARWTPVAYAVACDLAGGTVATANVTSYTIETETFTLVNPTKAGYTFNGWKLPDADDSTAVASKQIAKGTTGDLSFVAVWTAATYTVSFNSNGGSSATDQTVTYAGAYGALPVTTRTGYTFNGWYTAASGGTKVESTTSVTMTADHTLYAQWTLKQYTVTYEANGGNGTVPALKTVDYTTKITIESGSSLTYKGYVFNGWTFDGRNYNSGDLFTVTENVTFTASWSNLYTITFVAGDGNGYTTKDIELGGTLTVPDGTGFTRTGYAFAGWKCGATLYNAGDEVTVTTPMTFNAQWTANTYTVSFDKNGGDTDSDPISFTVTYDGKYVLPTTNPTKANYTFSGWFTAPAEGTRIESTMDVTVAADHTLYARWTPVAYAVACDLAGGTVATANVTSYTIETETFTLVNPTKAGYTFNGWKLPDADDSTAVASKQITKGTTGDLSFVAVWTAATYTVSFNSNGGSSATDQTVTYAGAYGALPVTTRTGYTFNGWYTAASEGTKVEPTTSVTMTADHTLYAQWTAATYTVSFNSNGGSSATDQTVTYAGAYGDLPVTTRTGYTFNGWYTAASEGTKVEPTTSVTMTADHTLYAQWTPATYTVTFDKNGGDTDSVPASVAETYDGTYVFPSGYPTKDGYDFIGWFTANDDTGRLITESSTFGQTSTQTLYAHWETKKLKFAPIYDAVETTKIIAYAVTGTYNDAEIADPMIPDTYLYRPVTVIKEEAFYDSDTEEGKASGTLRLGANVTTIEDYAFESCTFSGDLTLPDNLATIGEGAFGNCPFSGLLTIGKNFSIDVTSVKELFENCRFASISVALGNAMYASKNGVLFSLDGKTLVMYPVSSAATTYTVPDGTEVIGMAAFSGMEQNKGSKSEGSSYSGATNLTNVIFPDTLTTIEEYAFAGCTGLTGDLILPDNLANVGVYAFKDCFFTGKLKLGKNFSVESEDISSCFPDNTFTSFEVSSGNARYASNGGILFSLDWKTLVLYPVSSAATTYTVPTGTEVIEAYAFSGAKNLTGVSFPASLKMIGYESFSDAVNLTSVVFPASLTTIDDCAFYGCKELAGDLIFPSTMIYIGSSAFSKCAINGKLVLPAANDCSINGDAFSGAKFAGDCSLAHAQISGRVFKSCTFSSGTISFAYCELENNAFYSCAAGGLASASFDHCTFAGYSMLYASSMPSAVAITNSTIDGYAFGTNANGVTFGGSLSVASSTIGEYTFGLCKGLSSITLQDCTIGKSAFYKCTGSSTVTITDCSIGTYAFMESTGFTGLSISGTAATGTSIGYAAFFNSGFTGLDLSGNITEIEEGAFNYCYEFSDVDLVIPETVGTLPKAFSGSTFRSLTVNAPTIEKGVLTEMDITGALKIGSTVTSIATDSDNPLIQYSQGVSAVFACPSIPVNSLKGMMECNLVLESTVTSVDNGAFPYSGFSDVSISVPEIVTTAFQGKQITGTLTLTPSVTKIGAGVFINLQDQTSKRIQFTGTKAQWESITKEAGWTNTTGYTSAQCTDGLITF